MDTKHVLGEEKHLVLSEKSKVETQESLNYTITETGRGQRSLAFASSNQTLEESSVQTELLQESAKTTTVLRQAQEGTLLRVKEL